MRHHNLLPQGPVEQFEAMCAMAKLLDRRLLEDSSVTFDEANQMAREISNGSVFEGKVVTINGLQVLSAIDEELVTIGRSFNTSPSESMGIYMGVRARELSYPIGMEGLEYPTLRAVHMLRKSTQRFLDSEDTLFEQTPHDMFSVQNAEFDPETLYGSHSFKYLESDLDSRTICAQVDESVMNIDDPEQRLQSVISLIRNNLHCIYDDDRRYKNIMSYINSLGILEGMQCVARFFVQAKGDDLEIKIPADGSLVFDTLSGFEIAGKQNVKHSTFKRSSKKGLYVMAEHEQHGNVSILSNSAEFVASR